MDALYAGTHAIDNDSKPMAERRSEVQGNVPLDVGADVQKAHVVQ